MPEIFKCGNTQSSILTSDKELQISIRDHLQELQTLKNGLIFGPPSITNNDDDDNNDSEDTGDKIHLFLDVAVWR